MQYYACNTNCSPSCLTCKDTADNCKSCRHGFVLRGSQCLQCLEGCDTCEIVDDSSVCTSCLDGYYLDGQTCEKCLSSCETCYSGNPYYCYTCSKGFYKYQESTFAVIYAGQCKPCGSLTNCGECTSNCTDDILDKYKDCKFKCTKCADNFYYDFESNQFSPCDPLCKVCYGPNSNECEVCNDNFFLEGTECVGCDPSCQTCSVTKTNYTSLNFFFLISQFQSIPKVHLMLNDEYSCKSL